MPYVAPMSEQDELVGKGRHPNVLEYRRQAALRYLKLRELKAPQAILSNERQRILISLPHPVKRPFPVPASHKKRPLGAAILKEPTDE
ncbi:hypothetical protein ES705_35506 [subsurface metagenome]